MFIFYTPNIWSWIFAAAGGLPPADMFYIADNGDFYISDAGDFYIQ